MRVSRTQTFFIILVSAVFVSCATTRTYEKSSQQLFQDDLLIGEETFLVMSKGDKIDQNKKKVKEKSGQYVSTFDIDGVHVEAKTVISKKSGVDDVNVKLYKNNQYITERDYQVKKGKIIEDSAPKSLNKAQKEVKAYMEKKFEINDLDECFENAMKVVINPKLAEQSDGIENITNVVRYEKAVVESKPNGKYIAYSFFGKPFVILGSTIFNLVKSVGYSFVNFIGGYSTLQYGTFFWMMPDVSGARNKANKAKVENQIAYPEYHIPFTDNHISIDRITGETETRVSEIDPDEITVTSKEEHEFDNSLSVKKSVEKDVNRTTSVIGLAGTIITVPISAVTWFLGAVVGLYYK